MLFSSQRFHLIGILCTAPKLSLILLCSALMACGGGSNAPDSNSESQPEPTNTAPSLTLPASISIAENSTLVGTASGSDADSDSLTFSLTGGADQALFTIDASTGGIAFGGAPDFEAPEDTDGANTYEITVQVSDGNLSDSVNTLVTVTDVEEPVAEEPVIEQPDPLSTQSDTARAGKIAGVNIWQLPNSPDGDRPDQCWLAVGSDPSGEIYISGHDHQTNSMLYRMYQSDNTVRWIGDARTASEAANNWENGETAEKFHTRPIHHDGQVYVATLDNSNMDNGFRNTRGFHWYSYKIGQNRFYDLSATETNGVGAETLQIATIQIDPINNLLYGMSIPENKLVRYDIAAGTTTVLGNPDAWTGYFYTNRFMWVDSRGRVYITGGSSRGQWNKGEDTSVFNHVWYYDPATGFGELPEFALQGANSMEVGQWDREHKNLYTSDDQGNIYRFNDAAASWTSLGRPGFSESLKTWIFQLSADEEKIYIGLSDGSRPNAIYEYDIASGDSYELLLMTDLDDDAATENFITGYDSWDSKGSFYIASFSMYDNDNVYMLGINPVEIKLVKGLLTERVEVTATMESSGNIRVSRGGSTTASLDVLYEIRGSDSAGKWVTTAYGEITVAAQQSGFSIDPVSLSLPAEGSAITYEFVVVPDGNDYLMGADTAVDFIQ